MFGAGGGTSSYEEVREVADLIVLWGSNAREAHPIFFHHVLKAMHRGAKLMVVDPRRTTSAQWADLWLGLDVGTRHPARERGRARDRRLRARQRGVHRARDDRLRRVPRVGRAVDARGGGARDRSPAARSASSRTPSGNAANPQLCWTLGITEHHNAVDNVFALINLALLVGGVGRYGAGLQPLRGQNNVQGGGDMGAIPNKLPGFQDVTDDAARAKFEAAWGASDPVASRACT